MTSVRNSVPARPDFEAIPGTSARGIAVMRDQHVDHGRFGSALSRKFGRRGSGRSANILEERFALYRSACSYRSAVRERLLLICVWAEHNTIVGIGTHVRFLKLRGKLRPL